MRLMASLRFLLSAPACAIVALLGACSSDPTGSDHSAPTQTETGETSGAGGTNQRETLGSTGAYAGAAGKRGGNAPSSNGGDGNGDRDGGFDTANAGSAGDNEAAPPPPCDLMGNCDSSCENTPVTCGIQAGNECEYRGFVGATAQLTCGQHAVIGIACCGACDCVPVEVYFDGVSCWQGIPQCNGQLLYPHSTTSPNPSFTMPTDLQGSYTLGTAGGAGGASAGGGGGSGSGEPTPSAGASDAAGAAGAAAASDG